MPNERGRPRPRFPQSISACKDIWVEAHAASAARRDIELKLTYKEEQPYTVRATAIWVTPTAFRTAGPGYGPGTNDANDKIYIDHLDALAKRRNATDTADEPTPGFTFGKPNMLLQPRATWQDNGVVGTAAYQVGLHNIMEVEFTVAPADIGLEAAVRFDVTRTIGVQSWVQGPNDKTPQQDIRRYFPDFRERANDDAGPDDEDNTPENNHIYSNDTPGFSIPQAVGKSYNQFLDGQGGLITWNRVVHHMNAMEFVRVKVNGTDFTHDPTSPDKASTPAGANTIDPQGSRAGDYVNWRSWQDWTWNSKAVVPNVPPVAPGVPAPNGAWERTADAPGQPTRNAIEQVGGAFPGLDTPPL
ncbi:MAG: hypothetical protein K2X82_09970 [Gemmataceae bacterium]|nr:hypothetical protein [Gemmataceae bacterium]